MAIPEGLKNPLVTAVQATLDVTGQPVAVSALTPIPVAVVSGGGGGGVGGDASSANQVIGNASLANIETNTSTLQAGLTDILNAVQDVVKPSDTLTVNLPSGASTSALQTAGNASLSAIDAALNDNGEIAKLAEQQAQTLALQGIEANVASQTTLAAIDNKLGGTLNVNVVNQIDLTTITAHLLDIKNSCAAIDANTDEVEAKLDGIISSINTTGSANHSDLVDVIAAVQAIDANTRNEETILNDILGKLITSPATLAEQQNQSTTLSAIDTKLGGTLSVNVGLTDTQLRATPVVVSGTVTANTGLTQPLTDAELRATAVPVSASTLPLPTGAATSTLQGTANSTLANIDSKLGGTLAVNVGLTDTQLRATPVAVSGTVTANTGLTQPLTDAELRASAVNVNVVSGGGGGGDATAANQVTGNASLANIDTKTPNLVSGRVPVDGSAVTQPVSATSLPLPTGAATSALQATGNATLSAIDTKLGGTLSVNVGLTDTQLRATAVPVSFSGNVNTKPDGTLWTLTGTSANVNVTNASVATVVNNATTTPVANTLYSSTGGVALYPNAQGYAATAQASLGALAGGAGIFAVRNTGSKVMHIKRLHVRSVFIGTNAATLSSFQWVRFNNATPTGTAIVVGRKNTANAATTATAVFGSPLTLGTAIVTDVLFSHAQMSQQSVSCDTYNEFPEHFLSSRVVLAAGEGIMFRTNAASINGVSCAITVEWDEV